MTTRTEPYQFPPLEEATVDGLLAIGGDLSSERLLTAYRKGIFPWYNPGQPILWWSPDPRTVLYPSRLRISRSLRKTLRHRGFHITTDKAFARVIRECAESKRSSTVTGTWITTDMRNAYLNLYRLGYAHSVETWQHNRLVGDSTAWLLGAYSSVKACSHSLAMPQKWHWLASCLNYCNSNSD